MATANIIELETCMKDCLSFCQLNPDQDYVQYHLPRLKLAQKKYEESVEISDRFYRTFANASIEDKKAWKAASTKVRAIQKTLQRYEVSGYPTKIILYWDVPIFRGHALEMLNWLAKHPNAYPEASFDETELRRLCENAEHARETRDDALEEYSRQAQFRSGALGTLAIYLSEFRETLRRKLGTKDEEYLAIRWPFTLSPDRPILL